MRFRFQHTFTPLPPPPKKSYHHPEHSITDGYCADTHTYTHTDGQTENITLLLRFAVVQGIIHVAINVKTWLHVK